MLLEKLIGKSWDPLDQVKVLKSYIVAQAQVKEKMTSEEVVQILWSIHFNPSMFS